MSHGEVGYQRPPVKNQFRKGQSGNPRGRWKGQRNLPPVLSEVLRQPVTVKQGDKSERMSKGEALIKMLMSKALNGDRGAIAAMLTLTEKIGRVQNADLKSGFRRYGFMLVPGMAASQEEWEREIAARPITPPFGDAPAAVPKDERYVVRRPLPPRRYGKPKSEELTEASISETARSQTPPDEKVGVTATTVAGTGTHGELVLNMTSPPKPDT